MSGGGTTGEEVVVCVVVSGGGTTGEEVVV